MAQVWIPIQLKNEQSFVLDYLHFLASRREQKDALDGGEYFSWVFKLKPTHQNKREIKGKVCELR